MDDLNNNEPLSGIAMVARSSVYSLRAASVVSDTTSSRSEDFIWKLNELRVKHFVFNLSLIILSLFIKD